MLVKIIRWLCKIFNIEIDDDINETKVKKEIKYIKREFMSSYELKFYQMLLELNNEYNIVPQVNLGTVITKIDNGYRNELFKNIDFGIFDKDFKNLLLLIEINDSTHNQPNRKKRDASVKNICESAGIKLMTFHTNMPNEKNYVINRIKTSINEINNIIESEIKDNNDVDLY